MSPALHLTHHRADGVTDVVIGFLHDHGLGGDVGEIQHVMKNVLQYRGALRNVFEIAPLFFSNIVGMAHNFNESHNGLQGGFDFMGNLSQIAGGGQTGLLGVFLGLAENLILTVAFGDVKEIAPVTGKAAVGIVIRLPVNPHPDNPIIPGARDLQIDNQIMISGNVVIELLLKLFGSVKGIPLYVV